MAKRARRSRKASTNRVRKPRAKESAPEPTRVPITKKQYALLTEARAQIRAAEQQYLVVLNTVVAGLDIEEGQLVGIEPNALLIQE